jgi:hypothetical protein
LLVQPALAAETLIALAAESLIAPEAAPVTPPSAATRRSRRNLAGPATPVADAPPSNEGADAPDLDTVLVAAEPFELIEPVVDAPFEPTAAESPASDDGPPDVFFEDAASAHTATESDAFEAAARLFSFTGEMPIQGEPQSDSLGQTAPAADHVAPRRNRGASFKRLTAASFSVGVMGVVGLLTVGLTTPAEAVAAPGRADINTSLVASAGEDVEPEEEIQAYVTPAEMQAAPIDRVENYSTLTMAQLASESGIANFSNFFFNNPNSPIQWPFAVGVPISYGFGMRDGSMHEGADFTPGEGAPIQSIADGVVRESTDSGGAFGVHIVIDHVIDGELVSSSYSHMQYGSRQVEVGAHVTVGTIVGRTGNTGRSFGAHLHFEMLANGTTPIDPIPWLRQHAGG